MKQIKKFILLKGKVETLSYFSEKIESELSKCGYECLMFDFAKEIEDFVNVLWFADETTALITFNFIGISGEEIFTVNDTGSFWKQRNITVINILVDHPFYYHGQLSELYKHSEKNIISGKYEKYIQFCVDRDHAAYCRRFFSEIKNCFFLNLAGSCFESASTECSGNIREGMIPFKKRKMDVMFAGNYTPLETFLPYINRTGEENAAFYFEILEYLKKNPDTEIVYAIEKFLKRDFPGVTEEEIKACMGNSMFLDLYIRFFFRGEVIKILVENGIKVDVFGSGWDLLDTNCPENLIIHGPKKTNGCLRAMADSKISLNVMPWFKNGAHDRIFSSMQSGCLCLTDKSQYLTETFKDKEMLAFYDLKYLEELPVLIKTYLDDESLSESIAENIAEKGRKYAVCNETWKQRTEEIILKLKDIRSI